MDIKALNLINPGKRGKMEKSQLWLLLFFIIMNGIEIYIKIEIRSTSIQEPLLINWFVNGLPSMNFPEEIPNKVVNSSPNTPINSINELALNTFEWLILIKVIYFTDD